MKLEHTEFWKPLFGLRPVFRYENSLEGFDLKSDMI